MEPQSKLQEEDKTKSYDLPIYSPEEEMYLRNLQTRLVYARDQRNQPRIEWDGMDYVTQHDANEKWAMTYIKPKKTNYEINYQSGTARQKMMALVASLLGLNLKADILAFDENDIPVVKLGTAIEDIIDKTEELDNDEEKQMLRWYEMMKQGDVFVEDVWDEQEYINKIASRPFNGKFHDKYWKIKTEKSNGRPVRNIINGLGVFLGDINQYFFEKQPYRFTVTAMSYGEVEAIYGQLENWKFVPKQRRYFDQTSTEGIIRGAFTLTDPPDGQVEIIKYVDVPNQEYQVLLNGIPMLPIGAPIPWGCEDNMVQQHFEPIRLDFAYGNSFIRRIKNKVGLSDEMVKLMLLKTWKSFMPALINNSGQVLPANVQMPGVITTGVPANTVAPLLPQDVQGVNNSEFAMYQEVTNAIDKDTVSQTFGGMREQGSTTATQIVELQRQAKVMLGNLLLSVTLLEKKLANLRRDIIVKNWFDPVDKVLNQARQMLIDKYRITSRNRMIEGKGQGVRFVVPTKEQLTSEQLLAEEEQKSQEMGMPIQIIAINPDFIKQAKLIWYAVVTPKEKKSSELSKMMFSEMINQAAGLGLQLNPAYTQEEFAAVWDKDPSKLFIPQQQQPQQAVVPGQAMPGGVQKPTVGQLSKLPSNNT